MWNVSDFQMLMLLCTDLLLLIILFKYTAYEPQGNGSVTMLVFIGLVMPSDS
jgi:hypothetical protein